MPIFEIDMYKYIHIYNFFVKLSHGESVIPNFFTNFRSHDKEKKKFLYEAGELIEYG